jgi:hypothetical protein
MGPEDFAKACRAERDTLLKLYRDKSGETEVASQLSAANLTSDQQNRVIAVIDTVLTDAYYGLLLALDGSASLGGIQERFVLTDGHGNTIANGDGRLEAAAWDALQSNR